MLLYMLHCVQAVNKDSSKAPFVCVKKRKEKRSRDPHIVQQSADEAAPIYSAPLCCFSFISEYIKGSVPAGG